MYIYNHDWNQIQQQAIKLDIALLALESLEKPSNQQKEVNAKLRGFLSILINLEDAVPDSGEWNDPEIILPPRNTLVQVKVKEFDEVLLATFMSEEGSDPIMEMLGFDWSFEPCELLKNNSEFLHITDWRFIPREDPFL